VLPEALEAEVQDYLEAVRSQRDDHDTLWLSIVGMQKLERSSTGLGSGGQGSPGQRPQGGRGREQ
jgi:hypothetical protein